jgi:hypothetical protein
MSATPMSVSFNIDVRAFVRAMKKTRRAAVRFERSFARNRYSPGDRHIERIVRDCLNRRQSPEVTARRLLVASDLAAVLDGAR